MPFLETHIKPPPLQKITRIPTEEERKGKKKKSLLPHSRYGLLPLRQRGKKKQGKEESGEFIQALLRTPNDVTEYAFAVGEEKEEEGPTTGNGGKKKKKKKRKEGILYPGLRKKYCLHLFLLLQQARCTGKERGSLKGKKRREGEKRSGLESYNDFIGSKFPRPFSINSFR